MNHANAADPERWLNQVAQAAAIEPVATTDLPADLDSAERMLAERHGDPGIEFADTAFGPGTDREAVYEAKNSTLGLSVDVSLIWNRALYVEQLRLLGRIAGQFEPSLVLDLGCEQGILTCFAAGLLPRADVIGVDRSPASIARAGELAERTGHTGVQFHVADILAPGFAVAPTGATLPSKTANHGDNAEQAEARRLVICSRCLTGESLPEPDDPDWQSSARRAAVRLAELVGSGGRLVLVERGSPAGLAEWIDVLAAAGLTTEQAPAGIYCDEPSNPGQPFTLAVLGGAGAGPATGTG